MSSLLAGGLVVLVVAGGGPGDEEARKTEDRPRERENLNMPRTWAAGPVDREREREETRFPFVRFRPRTSVATEDGTYFRRLSRVMSLYPL